MEELPPSKFISAAPASAIAGPSEGDTSATHAALARSRNPDLTSLQEQLGICESAARAFRHDREVARIRQEMLREEEQLAFRRWEMFEQKAVVLRKMIQQMKIRK